jgi:CshA-type fibril repeat protein
MRSTSQSQGQYNLNTTTGLIRFTPDSTFSGIATPVTYQIEDSAGRVFWSTYTPTLAGPPVMSSDSSVADFGLIQQAGVLVNDTPHSSTSFDNTTLKICSTSTIDTSCTGTTVQVANVGKFEIVAPANVKFTPCTANGSPFAAPNCTSGFVGSHTIKYRAADAFGQAGTSSYTVTTNPPAIAARGETKSVLPSSSISFTAITGSAGLSSGVGLVACLVSAGSCVGSNTVSIPGEGTFTLNQTNKVVTFVASSSMTAAVSFSVSYRVTDVANQTATAQLIVRAPLAPTANSDSPVGAAGATQRIAVLSNDSAADSSATLDASSLKLCPTMSSTAADCNLQTLTIAGKGTFTVQSDGTISFSPVAGFDGIVDSVKYLVRDSLGQSALGTISTTVLPPPAAATVRDQVLAPYASSITFSPLANDSVTMPQSGYSQTGTAVIDSSSLRLCSPNNSASSCSHTSITTAAGTYSLNTQSQVVTFTPVSGFSGRDLNAPGYSVCVAVSGSWAPQTPPNSCSFGSLDVTVSSPPPPTLTNASATGPMGTPLSIQVTNGSSAAQGLVIVTSSARLCFPQVTLAANCSETSLSTSEGVFSIDTNTGLVTFVPAVGFSGAVPAVQFAVSDSSGKASMAQLTVSIAAPPSAQNLTTTGSENQTQQATIAIPQSGSLALLDLSNNPVTNLVVQGGTYALNTQSGRVTFTPDPGFVGSAPSASVRVQDAFGQLTISSYTANVTATPRPPNQL